MNQGECDTCGHWSGDLQEGMCPPCTDNYRTLKVFRERGIEMMPCEKLAEAAATHDDRYGRLHDVLLDAWAQAAQGKGNDRHATGQAFEDQPMQVISQLIGSRDGMAFQAIKKIQESQRMEKDAAIRELLGAINYIAGMVIYLES